MRDHIKLIGGFNCDLTNEEANEWHEYIMDTWEFREFMMLEAKLRYYVRKDDYDTYTYLAEKYLDLQNKLFVIARDWYVKLRAGELGSNVSNGNSEG